MFTEQDAHAAIDPVCSFDEGQLDFFNFLECLVRVTRVYPFTAEQEAILTSPDQKLRFLCEKVDDKFGGLVEQFRAQREEIERTKMYQPRVVVDDEEDVSDDDDDE